MFIKVPTSCFIAGQKSILPKFQHKGNRPQSQKITILLLLDSIFSFILNFTGNGDMISCLSFFQYILFMVRTYITNIIQHQWLPFIALTVRWRSCTSGYKHKNCGVFNLDGSEVKTRAL